MKSKLFTWLIRVAFFIFGLLPLKVNIFLGICMGFLLQYVIRFKKQRILTNLGIVYGEKKDWPKNIVKKIYRHMGLLFCELLSMPAQKGEKYNKRFYFHDKENLKKALDKGQGVIIVSAHTGNWEYGISGLALRGYLPSVIVKALKDIDNEYVFEQIRGSKGVNSILKNKAVLNIRRALKKNELVVMVIDQNSKRNEGVFVDHFGQKASTYVAPYVLASRFKCPVMPVYNHRDENMIDHHITFYPEIEPDISGEDTRDQVFNTETYIKSFEDFLLKHPEQWIWMHRRWRTQPEEEKVDGASS